MPNAARRNGSVITTLLTSGSGKRAVGVTRCSPGVVLRLLLGTHGGEGLAHGLKHSRCRYQFAHSAVRCFVPEYAQAGHWNSHPAGELHRARLTKTSRLIRSLIIHGRSRISFVTMEKFQEVWSCASTGC